MKRRAQKSDDSQYYKMVIIGFTVVCVVSIVYIIIERRPPADSVKAVDYEDIDKHNARENVLFQRANMSQFEVFIQYL